MTKGLIIKTLPLTFLLLLALPRSAVAGESRLFFMSGSGVYQYGKTFRVYLAVNSGRDKGINAAEGTIKYDPAYFSVKNATSTGSIFKLWVKQPSLSTKNNTITFSGGLPKAYDGTAGPILAFELTPKKYGKTSIKLENCSVLSADGTGADILKETWSGVYTIGTLANVTSAGNFTESLSGRILLQVQRNGEAWYIYPKDLRRYFLGRPHDAFDIMRKLGLGATHQYISAYLNKTYPREVWGKILLDVEKNGEAYYINPADKKGYYLGRPADAFRIMREKGLGITNDNLDKIPNWAI